MRIHRILAPVVLGATAAMTNLSAQAALSVHADNVTVAPGAAVTAPLSFEVSSPYELIALDLRFEYDASTLTFDQAASKVTLDGQLSSLADFFTLLQSKGSLVTNSGTDAGTGLQFGAYSFSSVNGLVIHDTLLFQPVFHLTALNGGDQTQLRFAGELADSSAIAGDVYDLQVAVRAAAPVPEPSQWLLFITGLLVVGGCSLKRCQAH